MNEAQDGTRKKTNLHLAHGILCDLGVIKAQFSKEANKMLSYEETLAELIRRHHQCKEAAA